MIENVTGVKMVSLHHDISTGTGEKCYSLRSRKRLIFGKEENKHPGDQYVTV